MSRRREGGWIEVICGSMFSGKSDELLRRVERVIIARRKVQVFKPSRDDRYATDEVVAHTGNRYVAVAVPRAEDILQLVDPDTQVVAIDEAQFFDYVIVDVCQELADSGRRVIVAGLDQDFRGEPFGPVPFLMAVAEEVDKLHAICVVCGEEASRSQRLINGEPAPNDAPTILVAGAEAYEARCRQCYQVPKGDGLPEAITYG